MYRGCDLHPPFHRHSGILGEIVGIAKSPVCRLNKLAEECDNRIGGGANGQREPRNRRLAPALSHTRTRENWFALSGLGWLGIRVPRAFMALPRRGQLLP
ncbi:MAG: hypothetical protein KatS3mg111_4225 [Pirellulaceae bacterium]|nr:MAG: hypothetical protein KatS3mg111_4225 [Pirellulaceae bacterium]